MAGFLDPRQPAPTRASNLAFASDGVPYLLPGADEVAVYIGPDGNYYFIPRD